ncbi:MAG: glycine--tRNA ligase [Candidatus Woesearchaeota archaeon]
MSKYDDVVNWALRRGIFFPASEIYANAPAGFYDFGPYGAAIRRRIIDVWRKELVQKTGMLEIYGCQIMPADVFKSSGHLASFNDPVTQCAKCNTIHRADKLLEDATGEHFPEAMSNEQFDKEIQSHKLACPKCKGALSPVRRFNMMVRTEVGVSTKADTYLRPETCQSIFCDWQRLMKTMRIKLPQGIAQVGRSFRNEISPRQTLLRQVEFSQMEAEVFFDPASINEVEGFDEIKDHPIQVMRIGSEKIEPIFARSLVDKGVVSGKMIAYFMAHTQRFFESLGIPREKMRFREVGSDERPFYSKETWDFEVETSLGWVELVANNNRTDYDIKGHAAGSKQALEYVYPDGKKIIPHIWEISIGLDRTFYAAIEHAYREEEKNGEKRIVLGIKPQLAPLTVAVFPLLSNKEELKKKACEVYSVLQCFDAFYDESGSIGKRYARMDEVGCPWAVTIDFDSLKNEDVTLRDRDTTEQKRVKIKDLKNAIYELYTGQKQFSQI